MITNVTQRWTAEGKPVYRPLRDYFNPRNYTVEAIDERTAKDFIVKFHYSKCVPAARRRFGLFEKDKIVGCAIFSHPMSEKVITNVFGCEKANSGLELGRLCLTDDVLSNGESYFVAECHRRLKKEGFVGVVSFSDDTPRHSSDGTITHFGHVGTVFQALNASFLNRSTPSKLYLLPDGTNLSIRTISKIRSGESGCQYGSKLLEKFGAETYPEEPEARRDWLKLWLPRLTRRINHPGNLRYGWSFCDKVKLKSLPYPKIRYCDVQGSLRFEN